MSRDRRRHVLKKGIAQSAQASSLTLDRLNHALHVVAQHVVHDPAYAPIYERLEREIELERQSMASGVIQRARALLDQKAKGDKRSESISSDAPLP
jgi:hypothetical protein